MNVRDFVEAKHPLIQALATCSDLELVQQFQQHPDQGQHFVTIFCRYSALSYVLIRNMARAELQTDYLFAKVWRNIFFELTYLNLGQTGLDSSAPFSLQTWIFNKTAVCINQAEIPAIETIQYTMDIASPPFWCYLQLAIDQLPALQRLTLLLSETFRWPLPRILALLQAEGEPCDLDTLKKTLAEAYDSLIASLPQDIQEIYLMPSLSNPGY